MLLILRTTQLIDTRCLFQLRPPPLERLNLYSQYGVATISRLLKIIGLFCKKLYKRDDILQKRPIILRSLLLVFL